MTHIPTRTTPFPFHVLLCPGCITVYLRSKLNEVVKKKITDDDSKIRSFDLASQDEGTKCVRGLNYGIKDGQIYASGGCKGYFTVCMTDSNLPEKRKYAHPWTTYANVFALLSNHVDN